MPLSRSRFALVGNVWFATVTVVSSCLMANGTGWSTSALLFALGVAPLLVIRIVGFRPPPVTIGEVIYDAEHPRSPNSRI